mmetsp:Transcript_4332/g.6587  ORF Transcript_4332/g.6587 Transcript_4332/m.6587 type:complete len:82 (+) Transcript_4332:1708-1953(+)
MLLQQSPRETQQWHSISPLCKLFSSERTNANKLKMLHQSMVRTIIKTVNDINSMTSQYVILTQVTVFKFDHGNCFLCFDLL